MTDPIAQTFVRQVRAGSSEWYRSAQDRLLVDAGESEAFWKFRVSEPEHLEVDVVRWLAGAEDDFLSTAAVRSMQNVNIRQLTWNSRPAVVAGSAERPVVVSGSRDRQLAADVTADYKAAIAAGAEFLVLRLAAASTTRQFITARTVELEVTYRPRSLDPEDVAPVGAVGRAKPVVSWRAPSGVTAVRVEVSELSDFSTLLYDSGEYAATTAQVDTGAVGPVWAGLTADVPSYIGVSHLNPSGWSVREVVSVTLDPLPDFVVSNPGATDADPTPPSAWSPAAASAEVVSYIDGVQVDTTGLLPGPVSSAASSHRAPSPGQTLRRVHRLSDGVPRADSSVVEVVTETVYTPSGVVAGLSGFDVTQIGETPAVSVWHSRSPLADDVAVDVDGVEVLTFPGTTASVVDWTLQPNTDISVGGRAVVNGDRSAALMSQLVRTKVTGVWLVDPETGRGCVLAGLGVEVGMGGEVVVHTPMDGATLLRHTLTLRGPEGKVSGRIADWPGRQKAEQKADVEWLRERPQKVLRLVMGDLNVPVVCSSLQAVFNVESSFYHRIEHDVTFDFSYAGGR